MPVARKRGKQRSLQNTCIYLLEYLGQYLQIVFNSFQEFIQANTSFSFAFIYYQHENILFCDQINDKS